jgi:hypothetical protein
VSEMAPANRLPGVRPYCAAAKPGFVRPNLTGGR